MKLSLTGSLKNSSFRSLTGTAALLAAALGLNLLGPHRAFAAPRIAVPADGDLGVTLLSPDPHTALSGLKPVEISAFYQGTPGNQIVSVELYLDGTRAATKTLDVPETRGVVSFLVDASQITPGTHKIVVRATAADQQVKSIKGSFLFSADSAPLSGPALSIPAAPGSTLDEAPTLRLINPSTDGKVQGVVTLRVEAHDSSGKAPYVSLFVDKTFKTLRNFAPYEFEWDTTAYSNGAHTIEVYGYNDSPHVGHAKAIQLLVNNPGGETQIRHDLLDGVQAVKPLKIARPLKVVRPLKSLKSLRAARPAAPRKALGRPLPLRRPDVFSADAYSADEAAPQMAAIHPMRPAGTPEIVRELTRGAGSLHFGSVGFAADLSAPFVTPQAAPVPPMAGSRASSRVLTTPRSGFRAMPGALPSLRPATEAARRVDPAEAALAEMPAQSAADQSVADKIARKIARVQRLSGQRLMALHLPADDLASPFLAAPRAAPHAVAPVVKLGTYQAEMRVARSQPAAKMHPLRVHLPASLGSLLRAVGQKSLLYNHTVVQMDRPLSAQDGIVFGPLRQIFEQSGGTLTWQAQTGTVRAKNATKDITLTIGQPTALVNDKKVSLDGTPYLLTGRTMVPLSFVSAAMDADVQYDAATGHLLITSRK